VELSNAYHNSHVLICNQVIVHGRLKKMRILIQPIKCKRLDIVFLVLMIPTILECSAELLELVDGVMMRSLTSK
jgi:hypothetical protein